MSKLRMKSQTVEPRYNELRYNEDPVITNSIWKPSRITVTLDSETGMH